MSAYPRRTRLDATEKGADNVSTHSATTQPFESLAPRISSDLVTGEAGRYEGIEQYSLAKILWVWAAAAVPMGLLAWVVAPLLRDQLGGRDPFVEALLICLTAGLVWQFLLVVILVRQELGSLEWSRVRDALWLKRPVDTRTGHIGGKVWWWAALFALLVSIWSLVPLITGPTPRDFGAFLGSDRAETFFSGAWGWYAVIVVFVVFNTAIGEELLFRGLLLPRMRGAFGRRDWIANGTLFTLYHVHQPWSMPGTLVEGIFLEAYPARRFQSAWIGIIVHSVQSIFVLGIVLALVL
jgi:uncharacterized protein